MSVTFALFEKNMIPKCTQTSQNTECPVGYNVYFLIIYFLKGCNFKFCFLFGVLQPDCA